MKICAVCKREIALPALDAVMLHFVSYSENLIPTPCTAYLCRSEGDRPGCAEDVVGTYVPDLLLSVIGSTQESEGITGD